MSNNPTTPPSPDATAIMIRRQTEQALAGLANQIAAWWHRQMEADSKLRKGELLRRYPALGTDKTFNRFVKSDFSDTASTLDTWLSDYRTVWQQIEELSVRQANTGTKTTLTEFSGVKRVRTAVAALTGEISTRRILLVTGESGTGKSCCVSVLKDLWGARVVSVEVMNVWADKPNRLLTAICEAVDMKTEGLPAGAADKMPLLIKHLNATRTCLVLEEGHHMGPQMLNTLKTLVNQTPGEFVIIAIPTLLRRLQTAAYEEARQIFASHRLAERIDLKVTAGDTALLLTHRFGPSNSIQPSAIWLTDPMRAPKHGNFGFIRDVANEVEAQRKREGTSGPLCADEITAAAAAVINKR
jgi:type II secretory pathway predicted ATPase ExeA